MGNSLGAGNTGYINYSYTVVKEDLGKDLSNIAIVKGKTPIPQGEKPIVTPVEPPEGSVIIKKVVIQPDKEYTTPPDVIGGQELFEFTLQLRNTSGNIISNSNLTVKLPENREMTKDSNTITFKLGADETVVIQRS